MHDIAMANAWVFLVECTGQDANLALFWHRATAVEAARTYLSGRWSSGSMPDDIDAAIRVFNEVADDEHVVLGRFEIEGNPRLD